MLDANKRAQHHSLVLVRPGGFPAIFEGPTCVPEKLLPVPPNDNADESPKLGALDSRSRRDTSDRQRGLRRFTLEPCASRADFLEGPGPEQELFLHGWKDRARVVRRGQYPHTEKRASLIQRRDGFIDSTFPRGDRGLDLLVRRSGKFRPLEPAFGGFPASPFGKLLATR